MYDVITIGAATRDVCLRSGAFDVHATPHSPTGAEQCLPLGAKLPIDDIAFTTGGGATNAAVTFRRLGGLRTACVCRIGARDTGGFAVLRELRRDRVDVRAIQRDAKRHTGYSIILLSSGERTILVYRGASHAVAAREIPWGALRTRWFYITSLGGNLALVRRILAHARRIGARVAWNPGDGELAHGWKTLAPLAAQCAVFNLNREEAAQLTGRDPKNLTGIRRALCGGGSHIALITDGPGGAYACGGDSAWHIASRNLKTVNTTGAGDAFGSAFVLGLMRSTPSEPLDAHLDAALRLAMANAEGVITHMGAKTGILTRAPSRAALAKYQVRTM